MSCKDFAQILEQFIIQLNTKYRYGVNEHITFNKDIINSLRIADLTQVLAELLKKLENEPTLTPQQIIKLMDLFPEWNSL